MRLHLSLLLLSLLFFQCKTQRAPQKTEVKPAPSVEPQAKEAQVQQNLSTDSLDLKIGQMIMVGLAERTSLSAQDSLRQEFLANRVGGIILFEKNLCKTNTADSLKLFIKEMQSLSAIPLFVSIDEEGGKVHRLKEKYGFVAMPSAAYLGALNNLDSTKYYSARLAEEMDALGININFAPCVDLATNPENPIIAKVYRSYGADWQTVSMQAQAFIEGHHKEGVKVAIKHFPGHGSSAGDTHKGIADVTKQWQWQELFPYKEIISAGICDAVLSCHIINCHLDTTCLPSTLSKTINTDILRNILGFQGVLFSDDMQMYAISKNFGQENAIIMSINSGVDVLVFGNNVNQTDRIGSAQVHAIIKRAVLEGKISMARINEAYARIMALKRKKVK